MAESEPEEGPSSPLSLDSPPSFSDAVERSEQVRFFGDYELLEEISRGGMGVVYKARQLSVKRTVALKMLRAGPFASRDFVQRFYHEAEAVARLDHPNIVPIYEIGQHEGQYFFTMRLVEGPNLAQAMEGRPLPGRRAAELMVKIARAVQSAHERGVLHRDIKPANILLDAAGEPFVTDFGLAKLTQSETLPVQAEGMSGTPHYMAPEQASPRMGETGTATDVYGLGVVLYQMLTARTPFKGETVEELLEKIVTREPPHPHLLCPELAPDLETICLHCLEKRPADRYFFAGALADDLERWLRGEPIHARPVSASERVWKWVARHPGMATLASAAACAVLALAIGWPLALWRIRDAREAEQLERARADYEIRVSQQQRAIAEEQRTAAEEHRTAAQAQQTEAKEQRHVAEERQHEVNRQREAAQLALYVSDMKLAQAAWDQGYASRMLQLLTNQPGAMAAVSSDPPDFRGFEWYYLQHALTAEHDFAFNDHKHKSVQGIAWSPNGQWLLTACPDDVHLVDLRTRTVAQQWPLKPPLDPVYRRGLAVSADGELMAAASAKGVLVWRRSDAGTVLLPTGPCSTVAFAPNDRLLASGIAWRGGVTAGESKVQILDLTHFNAGSASPETVGQFDSEAMALGWSLNGRTLTAITPRGTIRMFSLASNAVVRTFRGSNTVTGAALSPNGRWAARALASGQILITDLVNGETRATLREPSPIDMHLTFSQNSHLMAAAGGGQIIRLWETETWHELSSLRGHSGPIIDVAFGPTELVLASVGHDNQTQIWRRLEKAAPAFTRGGEADTEYPNPPVFSPAGTRIAVSTRLDEFALWSPNSHTFKSTNYGRALGFSPDSNRLLAWSPKNGSLELRNAANGALLSSLPLTPAPRNYPCPMLSPDGRSLVAYLGNQQLALYDAATGRVRKTYRARAAAWQFSPDGRKLAVLAEHATEAGGSNTNAHPTTPLPPALPEAKELSPLRRAQELLLIDMVTGQVNGGLSRWSSPSLCFSPDGRTLAIAPEFGTVALLEVDSGRPLALMQGLRSVILSMAFSPDGQRLATGSLDDDVVLWHVAAHREIASFPLVGPVHGLAFSPNGRLLVAGGSGPYAFLEAPGLKSRASGFPGRISSGPGNVWQAMASRQPR